MNKNFQKKNIVFYTYFFCTIFFIHLLLAESNSSEFILSMYLKEAEKLKDKPSCAALTIYLENALLLQPNNPSLMFDLANGYNTLNENVKALQLYYELLQKLPNHKVILYNTAFTLKKLGKVKEALIFYNAAIEQDQNYAEAHFSRSLAHLVLGDFEQGWAGYEWRWDQLGYKDKRFTQPMWDGSDPRGKVFYVLYEQGIGDGVQFSRYVRELKRGGALVVVGAHAALIPILSLCSYIDKVVPMSQQPVTFDYYVPLMSLPYLFKTTIDTVPLDIPYLYPCPELKKYWGKRLEADKNFKVGICFQGNANYRTPSLRAVVAAKSFPLAWFAPLGKIPGVSLYNLQKISGTDQLNNLPDGFVIHDFGEEVDTEHGRYMDTAAIISHLDLIVSIDTSTAHLAAALGAEVWILIPNPPDWRWMLDREDTPWYPNMRLFRQTTVGDWPSVIERVAQELSIKAQYHQQQNGAKEARNTQKIILVNALKNSLAALDNTME